MISVDVSISDPRWDHICRDAETMAEMAVKATFEFSPSGREMIQLGVMPEVSIVLGNDDLVQTLNREYRDKNKPTNILSFALLDTDDGWQPPGGPGPCALGDLVVALETLQRESSEENKLFHNHFAHLIVHGTLHLLGYDHMADSDANEMETIEIQILKELDVPNPYKD